MRILVVGANGFIGSAIVAAARAADIDVRGAVRDPDRLSSRFPGIEAIGIDLGDSSAHAPDAWAPLLKGIDAVVFAAGVLQPRGKDAAWAIQVRAPDALYAACETAGVRRVVHISAVGVDQARTVFAESKLAADKALMARNLDWSVLRPAVVVGEGSYGGTSMLRAIAAFPGLLPVIGDGRTEIDFIHNADLADAVIGLVRTGAGVGEILEPASAERMTLADTIQAYRRWLGLPVARVVGIPVPFVKAIARIGDMAKLDPIVTTAVTQFETRLTGDAEKFTATTGIAPRGLTEMLAGRPSESQDLWHARLYLARPVVRLSLAVLWLVSGLLGLFGDPIVFERLLAPLTQDQNIVTVMVTGMSLVDLAIAVALFTGWRLKLFAYIQLVVVLGYTLAITVIAPGLWTDPLGSVLKNIPILALLLVHRVLEQER